MNQSASILSARQPQEPRTRICQVVDLGVIPYAEAVKLQESLVAARKAGAISDVLLLCQHPHVITLGRSGKLDHLRASEAELLRDNVEFHQTKRGGDITYHGPGQLVGYPILNLGEIRRDVVWYVRQLEELMIRATAAFGVTAGRVAGCTGVWIEPGDSTELGSQREKLASIGVHISRWVTSHGFAYNVSTDLHYFDLIVPCGIAGCRTTSLSKLLARPIELAEFAPQIVAAFGDVFGMRMLSTTRQEFKRQLQSAEVQLAAISADR